jgi:Flp pilus assembly protein TadB
MSLIPRRERSDAERRRLARIHGLKPSATWSEIDFELIHWRRFRRLAESYGLEEDATWDDVYAADRRKYDEKRGIAKAALYAAIPGAILFLVWMHWITIIIALVVFVALFHIIVYCKSYEWGEHRHHMIHSFPEFKKRAERDGKI